MLSLGTWSFGRGFAEAHGYVLHVCARPNGKADGCAMLIRASKLARPPIFAAFHYDDWGSRVVQQCTLELIGTSSRSSCCTLISPFLIEASTTL